MSSLFLGMILPCFNCGRATITRSVQYHVHIVSACRFKICFRIGTRIRAAILDQSFLNSFIRTRIACATLFDQPTALGLPRRLTKKHCAVFLIKGGTPQSVDIQYAVPLLTQIPELTIESCCCSHFCPRFIAAWHRSALI